MRKSFLSYILLLLPLSILTLLGACNNVTPDTSKRSISVTILPQQYLAEQIAGERFHINCVVPANNNPEAYDPTPAQLIAIDNSEAYLRVGMLGFEMAWIDRISKNSPHLQFYDTSQGIDMIVAPHTHHAHDGHTHIVDPHIWCSPRNARIMAHNIYNVLCSLDTAGTAYYSNRYTTLIQRIDSVESVVSQLLAPIKGKAFAIYHPSLSYMARDYGLQQIAIENAGKESSVHSMKNVIDEAREAGVEVVFVQREFNSQQVESFANELDCKIVTINPLNYDWAQEMIDIAYALAQQ